MLLLDRAIKLAAEQDEPDEMNFVRKHAKQQAAELGLQVRAAEGWGGRVLCMRAASCVGASLGVMRACTWPCMLPFLGCFSVKHKLLPLLPTRTPAVAA